jgi:acyl-CoA thioester hydrolase
VPEPFSVRLTVRSYEIDIQGHLNDSVYVQYADHARWELVRAAGVSIQELIASGLGPVNLETTLRFRRELLVGDEVDVTCAYEWGEGKTFRVVQELRRADGTLAAEVESVCGLLDLKARRLVADPAEHWRRFAADLAMLGL